MASHSTLICIGTGPLSERRTGMLYGETATTRTMQETEWTKSQCTTGERSKKPFTCNTRNHLWTEVGLSPPFLLLDKGPLPSLLIKWRCDWKLWKAVRGSLSLTSLYLILLKQPIIDQINIASIKQNFWYELWIKWLLTVIPTEDQHLVDWTMQVSAYLKLNEWPACSGFWDTADSKWHTCCGLKKIRNILLQLHFNPIESTQQW